MDRLANYLRGQALRAYMNTELKLDVQFQKDDTYDAMMGKVEARLRELGQNGLERVSRITGAPTTRTMEELQGIDFETFKVEEGRRGRAGVRRLGRGLPGHPHERRAERIRAIGHRP